MNGVDFGDFTFWKQRYGDSNIPVASASFESDAVPEPTTLLLAAIAAGIAMRHRGGGPNPKSLFRAYRYAPDYPGLAEKDLTPGKTLEEHAAPPSDEGK
jgi:hypothetical protein